MSTAETMEAGEAGAVGESARKGVRTRWRVALAAVSVTAAVAMTGWALGTPPGGALPSDVKPADAPLQLQAPPGDADGSDILVPLRQPERTGPPGES